MGFAVATSELLCATSFEIENACEVLFARAESCAEATTRKRGVFYSPSFEYADRSLMLVTALSPVIGYDKASKIAHYALDNDLTLKAAALKLGFVTEDEFNRVVDPAKIVHPYMPEATHWSFRPPLLPRPVRPCLWAC